MSHSIHKMFKKYGTFKPVEDYSDREMNYRLKYRKDFEYGVSMFTGIINADYVLRGTIQREEDLKKKSRVLQKVASTQDDKTQLFQWYEELEDLQKKYSRHERGLYVLEAMLPTKPLKQAYDSIRKNPTWYLRKELVEDCVERGGCCSRTCGCCENRQLTAERRKGIGHCTTECGCCISSRGFEFTSEEKKEIEDQLDRMLHNWNPAYLLKMAEAYFSDAQALKPKKKERRLNEGKSSK